MAGILPFSRTIKNKKELIYFLFSRETMDDKKSKDRVKILQNHKLILKRPVFGRCFLKQN